MCGSIISPGYDDTYDENNTLCVSTGYLALPSVALVGVEDRITMMQARLTTIMLIFSMASQNYYVNTVYTFLLIYIYTN